MRFRDRSHAAQQLAARLSREYAPPWYVSGIPTGGLEIARHVARACAVPLSAALVRRLHTPTTPFHSFGALDERGSAVLDPAVVHALRLTLADLELARTRACRDLRHAAASLRTLASLRDIAPRRHVVLVDDGMATGYTMLAAIRAAKRMAAARVSVAVPCASETALERIVREADDVVCLGGSDSFVSIAACYENFEDEPACAHALRTPVSHETARDGKPLTSLDPR